MESLASLGLAANILQFLELSGKLVFVSAEVYKSQTGLPNELQDASALAKELQNMADKLMTRHMSEVAPQIEASLVDVATLCRSSCIELLRLVQKIRGSSGSSKAGSFMIAWRSISRKGELSSIQRRLNGHRTQMLDLLVILMRDDQSTMMDLIRTLTTQNETLAKRTRQEIQDARDHIVAVLLSEKSEQQSSMAEYPEPDPVEDSANSLTPSSIQTLLDIAAAFSRMFSGIQALGIEDRVLELIWFPELPTRQRSVGTAHSGTYAWLVDDQQVTENQAQQAAFVHWLRSDNGIFFVSGKPGSGKSTLMKLLSHHPRTRTELQSWAQQRNKDLILTSHFFWISGAPLQRNIEGFYRGILWEILHQQPALIKHVLPSLWTAVSETVLRHSPVQWIQLDIEDIRGAFQNLMSNSEILSQYRLCVFVDGLDEYDGDCWILTQKIITWSSDDVKFCVSSRPNNQIERAIASNARGILKLHEVTQADMYLVVQDEFCRDERFSQIRSKSTEYNELADSIIKRAEGVFLWVKLVIRILLNGLGDSLSITQLRGKLYNLPNGLNQMFQGMLESIEIADKARAAMSLMALIKYWGFDCDVVYVHAVMDDLLDNSIHENFILDGKLGPFMTSKDCVSKCVEMTCRLKGRFGGLIEITPTGKSFPFCHRLQFIHRTVEEFLKKADVIEELRKYIGNFPVQRYIGLGYIAMTQFVAIDKRVQCPAESICGEENIDGDIHSRSLISFYNLEETNNRDGLDPFLVGVNALHRMFKQHATQDLNNQITFLRTEIELGRYGADLHSISGEDIRAEMVKCSLLFFNPRLTTNMIKHTPGVSNHILLPLSVLRPENPCESIISVIFQHGARCNTETFELGTTCYVGNSSTSYFPTPPWTTWTLFLFYNSHSLRKLDFQASQLCHVESWLKIYLTHGADPCVAFIGYLIRTTQDYVEEFLGPFYADLSTMMSLWGFSEIKISQVLSSSMGHTQRTSFSRGRWWFQQGQTGVQSLQKLPSDLYELTKHEFFVLKVGNLQVCNKSFGMQLENALNSFDFDPVSMVYNRSIKIIF